jgi:hypothetical protein
LRVALKKVYLHEMAKRQRQWFSQDLAAELVNEASLAQIIEGWRQGR